MAISRQALRARVSEATGRQRRKPTSGIERAADDLKQLVSKTGDQLFPAKKAAAGPSEPVGSVRRKPALALGGHPR